MHPARTRMLAAGVAAGLLLAACGGDDDDAARGTKDVADSILDDIGASDDVRSIVEDLIDDEDLADLALGDLEDGDEREETPAMDLPDEWPDRVQLPSSWKVVHVTQVRVEAGMSYSIAIEAPGSPEDALDGLDQIARGAGLEETARMLGGSGADLNGTIMYEDDELMLGGTIGADSSSVTFVGLMVSPK